jgi:hypothetical protein
LAAASDGDCAGNSAGTTRMLPHCLHLNRFPNDCGPTAYFFPQSVHATVIAIHDLDNL